MPEYLSPGVYVEEIDAGPKPIEGVSTSTAGAVGITQRGPSSGKPELVTSFAEFQRKFGGFLDEPPQSQVNTWALNATEGGRWWLFPLSVKGFFDNGGQRLYVKRAFSGTAAAATVDLGVGVIAELTQDAAATQNTIRVGHHFGLQNGTVVNLFASGVALAANPFTVSAYEANGTLRLDKNVGADLKAGRDYVEVIPRAAAAAPGNLRVRAKSVGGWGNDIRVRVRPVAGTALRILSDPLLSINGGQTTTVTNLAAINATTIDVGSSNGFNVGDDVRIDGNNYAIAQVISAVQIKISPGAIGPLNPGDSVTRLRAGQTPLTAGVAAGVGVLPVTSATGFLVNDHVRIDGRDYAVTAKTANQLTVAPVLVAAATSGTPVVRLASANSGGAAATLNVQNASQLYQNAVVELDNGTVKETLNVTSVSGQMVTFDAPVNHTYFEGQLIRVIEAEVDVQYAPDGVLQATETFLNLRLLDDGSPNFIVRNVNDQSKYVELKALASPLSTAFAQFPSVPSTSPQQHWADLANGADNLTGLTVDDFVGADGGSGNRTGIASLEDIDEISICMVPGMWSASVQNALIVHCETLKDRFAVLDPRDGLSIEGVREFREPLDSKYAALYYPWLEVRDPSVGRNVQVAPSAHMAGIYARVDVDRGVHKAPANEVIRNITKIAQDVTKREQDLLNPKGINALRFFPGRGNRVWGARTISSDSSWKYINVRRLFIFVEESIDEGTQWVVFEPNDEPLWARVRQSITNFLTTVWRSGALQGATAAQAFFVRCDHTTMTQDDIDNGRLICQIGIAPVKPAEFVIFRIQQKTLDTPAA
jgi:phage tail sheath protein FI